MSLSPLRIGRKYQASLQLSSAAPQQHGLSLDLGVYVARIQPGSVAAKEGTVAVGDRILGVRKLRVNSKSRF